MGVGSVDFENLRIVAAHEFLEIGAFEDGVGLDFVEGHLLVDNLVVGVVESLQDVDSFLDLPDDGLDGLVVGSAGDGEFVYALDG